LLTYKEGIEAFRVTDGLVRWRPRQADGWDREQDLQMVADEGLSAVSSSLI
jgi:hypothetical protein